MVKSNDLWLLVKSFEINNDDLSLNFFNESYFLHEVKQIPNIPTYHYSNFPPQ
jgi:hypothetical protein